MAEMPVEQAQGEEPVEGGGDTQSEIIKLVDNIAQGMMTFQEVAAGAGAPESAQAKIQQAMDLFQSGVQELTGGGAPDETSGSRAVPAPSPEGRPMGPAGV